MTSEYLDRLKYLRDAKTPIGETANVQTNVSFRKAIEYIEKLENKIEQVIEERDTNAAISLSRKNRIHSLYDQRGTDEKTIIKIIRKYSPRAGMISIKRIIEHYKAEV